MRSERRLERVREARRRLARDGPPLTRDRAGAFDGERLRALRLPDPPFEPAFEDFQPFL
jgi:hypothetical protein